MRAEAAGSAGCRPLAPDEAAGHVAAAAAGGGWTGAAASQALKLEEGNLALHSQQVHMEFSHLETSSKLLYLVCYTRFVELSPRERQHIHFYLRPNEEPVYG